MLLQSPMESELGSPSNPVTPSSLKFDVEALDEQGRLMAVDANLSAYIVAGGSRLSLLDPCQSSSTTGDPALLKTIGMRGGKVTGEQVSLSLPAVFGRIAINLEELSSQSLSSTPPIYFPNPTIARLMKPLDVTAGNASFCSPYLARQVTIDGTATAPRVTSQICVWAVRAAWIHVRAAQDACADKGSGERRGDVGCHVSFRLVCS